MVAGFCITVQYYYYIVSQQQQYFQKSIVVVVLLQYLDLDLDKNFISLCSRAIFYSFYFCYTGALTDRECVLNSTKRVLKCNQTDQKPSTSTRYALHFYAKVGRPCCALCVCAFLSNRRHVEENQVKRKAEESYPGKRNNSTTTYLQCLILKKGNYITRHPYDIISFVSLSWSRVIRVIRVITLISMNLGFFSRIRLYITHSYK